MVAEPDKLVWVASSHQMTHFQGSTLFIHAPPYIFCLPGSFSPVFILVTPSYFWDFAKVLVMPFIHGTSYRNASFPATGSHVSILSITCTHHATVAWHPIAENETAQMIFAQQPSIPVPALLWCWAFFYQWNHEWLIEHMNCCLGMCGIGKLDTMF